MDMKTIEKIAAMQRLAATLKRCSQETGFTSYAERMQVVASELEDHAERLRLRASATL